MRRSRTIGLLAMLGLGLAFAFGCKKDNDDDDAYSGTGGSKLADDDDDSKGTGGKKSGTGGSDQADDDDDTTSEPAPCKQLEGLEDETCLSDVKASKAIPVNMLLVIDKSASMDNEDAYDQPKWQALTSALNDALKADAMINNPSMSVGLLLFPGEQVEKLCNPEDCCELPETEVNVELGPASDTVDTIIETLEGVTPTGLTPTADALDAALTYFETSPLEGDNYVLLATDGGPNCNGDLECENEECTIALDTTDCPADSVCCANDQRLWCVDWKNTEAKIAALKEVGVKTIVVGIPGSEAYNKWLDAFADAGGAVAPTAADEGGAHYYEVAASGGVDALTKTFQDITVSLVRSCRMQLDYTPTSTNEWLVNVALDCKVVPQGSEATGAAGAGGGGAIEPNWMIDRTTDPPTIELLGNSCNRVQAGVDRIDIIIGCPPRL